MTWSHEDCPACGKRGAVDHNAPADQRPECSNCGWQDSPAGRRELEAEGRGANP